MTRSWNNVMTRILEHCDDKGHGGWGGGVPEMWMGGGGRGSRIEEGGGGEGVCVQERGRASERDLA